MTLRATEVEATICEVPILFIERENGRSKMTLKIVLEAFVLTTRWGLERLFRR
jgi:dolichol-phosphate mannosyltransferase